MLPTTSHGPQVLSRDHVDERQARAWLAAHLRMCATQWASVPICQAYLRQAEQVADGAELPVAFETLSWTVSAGLTTDSSVVAG